MGGFAWTEEEDHLLKKCIEQYGEGKWHRVPSLAGLNRCRKSCRLRWLNYLRPNIKRGSFTEDEVQLIIKLHNLLGNRWSLIAGRLPGRTANDVKNYWNWHLSKRLHAKEMQEEEENNAVIQAKTKRPKAGSSPKMEYYSDSLVEQPALTILEESCLSTPPFHYVEVDQQGQELVKEEAQCSSLGVEEEHPAFVTTTDHDDLGLDIGQFDKSCKESCSSKWDWDDLVSDMDLWTESL